MLFTKFQSLKLSNKLKSLKVAKLKDDDGWVSGGTMVWGFVGLVVVDGLFESVCDSMCDGVWVMMCVCDVGWDVFCDVACDGVGVWCCVWWCEWWCE